MATDWNAFAQANKHRIKEQGRAAPNAETWSMPVILEPKRETRKVKNDYKAAFLIQLELAGLPLPVPEYHFARPERMWRFDWAYLDLKIAIEYQGGIYHADKSGHSTTKGLKNDYEKFTEASLRGWMLILIDSGSVRDGRAMTWVERALKLKSAK